MSNLAERLEELANPHTSFEGFIEKWDGFFKRLAFQFCTKRNITQEHEDYYQIGIMRVFTTWDSFNPSMGFARQTYFGKVFSYALQNEYNRIYLRNAKKEMVHLDASVNDDEGTETSISDSKALEYNLAVDDIADKVADIVDAQLAVSAFNAVFESSTLDLLVSLLLETANHKEVADMYGCTRQGVRNFYDRTKPLLGKIAYGPAAIKKFETSSNYIERLVYSVMYGENKGKKVTLRTDCFKFAITD